MPGPIERLRPDGGPIERIGKYKVVAKIGAGAMGEVYRALDPLIERSVAIKILSSDLDTAPELRKRFLREARSAGQLSHRNIVTLYDLVEDGDLAYMVMEFLEGEDLQTKIARHTEISLEQKLELMIEMSEGLAHAHQRGIVHRDIKPGNLFITTTGQLKILDFGLAHAGVSDITKTGHLMGTPNYMSPEQVRGEKTDERSDIFSMGAVCYELLTFKKPFLAPALHATFFKIIDEMPEPIDRVDPRIPRELAAVIERALAKAPAARYQKVSEMRRELEAVRRSLEARRQRLLEELRGIDSETTRLVEENRELLPDELVRRQEAEAAASLTLVPGRELEASETVSMPAGYLEALLQRENAIGERGRLEALLKRRRELAARLKEATRLEQRGEQDAALREVEQVLAEFPDHAGAQAAAQRLREAVAERARRDERRREVARLVGEARERERAGDLSGAREVLEQALALEPGHAEAASLLKAAGVRLEEQRRRERARGEERRRKLERALAAARKAVEAGDAGRSRRELEAALAVEPDAPEARELLARVETLERSERERRDALAARVAEARAAEAAGDLETAMSLARPLTKQADGPPEARQILERAEAMLAARRKREEAERRTQGLLAEAAALAERGDPRGAAALLERADATQPQVKQPLERYREAARAQEEARRRAAEIDGHLSRGKKAFERGEYTLCEQEMQTVLSLARDHVEAPTYLTWARERREEQQGEQERRARALEALRTTRQALAAGRLSEAQSEAERTLALDPGNLEAARLRSEVERRLAEAQEVAQRRAETIVMAPTSIAHPAAAPPARGQPTRPRPGIQRPGLFAIGALLTLAFIGAIVLIGRALLKPSPPSEATVEAVAPAISPPDSLPSRVQPPPPAPEAGSAARADEPPSPEAPPQPAADVEKRVSRSRQQAKALLDAGKLDEAAAAVGEALQLDPSDAQARRLLAEIDQRARKTAESAADAVSEARAKAVQARAAELAADSFETARQADQEGTRLLAAKRFAPAARILGEAAESYRRADAEARSEAARRAELERRAQVVPPAPPTVDEAALAAQRLLEDTRRGLEAAKRGAPADSRAAAEESAAQELVRQGRLAEAAAALKRAGSLYEAARLVERDRAAVLGALQRYRTALEGKDMGALKELWPTLAGAQEKVIRQSFQFTRSMRVELQPQDVQLAGDQATVRCQRRDEMVSVDGHKAQTDTLPTFVMRRKGESWLIETIR